MAHLSLGRGMGKLGVVCFMLAWCTQIPFAIAIHVRPATAVRSTSCKLLISCGVGLSGRPGASSTTQMSSHCSWLSMHRLRGGRDNSSSANLTSSEPNLDDASSRLNFENQTAISSLPGNIANVEDRQAPQSKLIQVCLKTKFKLCNDCLTVVDVEAGSLLRIFVDRVGHDPMSPMDCTCKFCLSKPFLLVPG